MIKVIGKVSALTKGNAGERIDFINSRGGQIPFVPAIALKDRCTR